MFVLSLTPGQEYSSVLTLADNNEHPRHVESAVVRFLDSADDPVLVKELEVDEAGRVRFNLSAAETTGLTAATFFRVRVTSRRHSLVLLEGDVDATP